jgi:chemotaxis protein MotB
LSRNRHEDRLHESGVAEVLAITKDDMPKLKEELEKAISKVPNFDKIKRPDRDDHPPEGLRIELLETETGTFFQIGNSAPSDNGKALSLLAQELGKASQPCLHRRSHRFQALRGPPRMRELGALHRPRQCRPTIDAARRIAGRRGFGSPRYADQMQRTPAQPLDASNRRISVIVQNLEPKPQELEKTDGKPETSAAPKDPRKRD